MVLDIEGFLLRARGVFKTAGKMASILRTIDRVMEEKGLKELTPENINVVFDELVKKGYNAGTLRRYYYCIKTYMDLMMVEYDEKKMRSVLKRLPPYYGREPDNLTMNEVRRLLVRTRRRDRRVAYALMYTYARRPTEVLSLRWGDIDLERGLIKFRILKKKRPEEAVYRLEGWLAEEIAKLKEEVGPGRSKPNMRVFDFTHEALNEGFKTDCTIAGIPTEGRRISLHILRRSRVTHLRMMGVPLEVVSKVLVRHSDPLITLRYYRAVSEEEVERIPGAYETLWGHPSKKEGGEGE